VPCRAPLDVLAAVPLAAWPPAGLDPCFAEPVVRLPNGVGVVAVWPRSSGRLKRHAANAKAANDRRSTLVLGVGFDIACDLIYSAIIQIHTIWTDDACGSIAKLKRFGSDTPNSNKNVWEIPEQQLSHILFQNL
jgi:hypothetical protein